MNFNSQKVHRTADMSDVLSHQRRLVEHFLLHFSGRARAGSLFKSLCFQSLRYQSLQFRILWEWSTLLILLSPTQTCLWLTQSSSYPTLSTFVLCRVSPAEVVGAAEGAGVEVHVVPGKEEV